MSFRSAHAVAIDPALCANHIGDRVFGANATVVSSQAGWTIFEISFKPAPTLRGYPTETVRLTVPPSGDPVAVAVPADREFLHRYPRTHPDELRKRVPPLEFLVGALCLWYPNDPIDLRWSWIKGLVDFVRIVQRHLWYEEHWRRTGSWPVEDAHSPQLERVA